MTPIVAHEFDSSAGSAFLGTVEIEFLDEMVVFNFECDPCEVKRSQFNIRSHDCYGFLLNVQLTGKSVVSQDARQAVIEHGSFALIDPRRPFALSFRERGRSVGLKFPRQAFEARLGGASTLTALAMNPQSPLVGLASGFLSLLPSRIESLDYPACAKISNQVLDLVALAMAAETHKTGTSLSSPRTAALLRLKTVTESRLSDPTLGPTSVAHAAGISVRYANVLLAQEGSSLQRYIVHRRLERCREALEDPHQAQRLVGDIAFSWGFSDLSHFGRRFKAAFGLSPRDFRQQCQDRLMVAE